MSFIMSLIFHSMRSKPRSLSSSADQSTDKDKLVSSHIKKNCDVEVQGCGNTMPDLSDLVQFHSGQVEKFYLLVLGQVQMY